MRSAGFDGTLNVSLQSGVERLLTTFGSAPPDVGSPPGHRSCSGEAGAWSQSQPAAWVTTTTLCAMLGWAANPFYPSDELSVF